MPEDKLRNSSPVAVDSYGVSWTLLVWLAALCVLAFGNKILNDPDTYWHTAVGDWILQNGAIPRSDPFSHSLPGTPWTAHEWLSEVVFSVVHSLAGWDGLVVLTALTFAATLAGMTRFLLRQRIEAIYVLLIVALSGGMMASHLLARPHSLVAPLLALWLAVVLRCVMAGAPLLYLCRPARQTRSSPSPAHSTLHTRNSTHTAQHSTPCARRTSMRFFVSGPVSSTRPSANAWMTPRGPNFLRKPGKTSSASL